MLDHQCRVFLRNLSKPTESDVAFSLSVEEKMRYRGHLVTLVQARGVASTPETDESRRILGELQLLDLCRLVEESSFILEDPSRTELLPYLQGRLHEAARGQGGDLAQLRKGYRENPSAHPIWRRLEWPVSVEQFMTRLEETHQAPEAVIDLLGDALKVIPTAPIVEATRFFRVIRRILSRFETYGYAVLRDTLRSSVAASEEFKAEAWQTLMELSGPGSKREEAELVAELLAAVDPKGSYCLARARTLTGRGNERSAWLLVCEMNARSRHMAEPDLVELMGLAFSLESPSAYEVRKQVAILRNLAENGRAAMGLVEDGCRHVLGNLTRNVGEQACAPFLANLGVTCSRVGSDMARSLINLGIEQLAGPLEVEAAIGLLSVEQVEEDMARQCWRHLETCHLEHHEAGLRRLLLNQTACRRLVRYVEEHRSEALLESPFILQMLDLLDCRGRTAELVARLLKRLLESACTSGGRELRGLLGRLRAERVRHRACRAVFDALLEERPGCLRDSVNCAMVTRFYAQAWRHA